MSLLKSALALAILAAAAHAGAGVIDFNGTSGASYRYANQYGTALTNNLSVSSQDSLVFMGTNYTGGDWSSYAYNGTDYLMGVTSMTFTATNAAAFSVQSLDMVAWAGGISSATLTGNFASGGSIVRTFTLDSAGNASKQSGNDFIKYMLNGYIGLSSFTVTGSSPNWLALDNITVNAATVPEPGTLAVFGLGMAGLAAMRRRKQK